jgi:hypothetical protein
MHIYVENLRYQLNYQKKNKTDSRSLRSVHVVISSNANMYERLDWLKSAGR